MALVQTYADQEVQCVARSADESYWGLFRERERIGDGIRAYLEAMVQNAYSEGRRDEQEELSSVLPGVTYMDPPDGGAPAILEQLQRQAKDAARYVWLRRSGYAEVYVLHRDGSKALCGDGLDAAVDAARDAGL